jgi:hypothetical protein
MSNIEMGSCAFGYEIFDRILKADRERESFGLFRRTVCYVPQHELQARKRRMVMKDRVLRIGWGGSSQKVIFAICALVFAVCVALPFSADAADKLVVKNGDVTKFVVTDDPKVGIGTATPTRPLTIVDNITGTAIQISASNSNSGGRANLNVANDQGYYMGIQMSGSAYVTPSLYNTAWFMTQGSITAFNISTNDELPSGGTTPINFMAGGYGVTPQVTIKPNGNVGIGTTSPTHPLEMAGGAYSDGNQWYPGSSRMLKENIRELGTTEAMNTLVGLNAVKYNYKNDKEQQHVGFIAEDVPDLVALKDRKALSPLDIVAVLTKVVQEQQKTITALNAKVEQLNREVKLKNGFAALETK